MPSNDWLTALQPQRNAASDAIERLPRRASDRAHVAFCRNVPAGASPITRGAGGAADRDAFALRNARNSRVNASRPRRVA